MESNVNKKHKSSMFSALFSTPEVLRELYSAIEGVDIPPDAVININTLSDALFMKQINDVSFTINDRIVILIEHQSTINENVPLRLLMYIGRIYEKIIERKKLYKQKIHKIPAPEFFVLYNGLGPCPDHKELRLSEAFKNVEGLKLSENRAFPLELAVQVYNINHGRNIQIQERSETLSDYSIFMDKVNEYKRKLPLDEAVTTAIKYCLERNILKQFLMGHGSSEVINMLFEEPTIEEIIEVRVEEALEEAVEEAVGKAVEKAVGKAAEEARGEEKLAIARNLLTEGSSPEFIQKITGLDMETIQSLNN